MLAIRSLELKNFRTFGNKITTINFGDLSGLTAIVGQNRDDPDPTAKNGCGKSTFIEAFAFALFGETIKQMKSVNSLVNKFNKKDLFVAVNFSHKGFECRIERRLKPSKLQFFKKPLVSTESIYKFEETRDSIAQTQKTIEEFIGISFDLFRLVGISATKSEAFFGLDTSVQKNVIETLFSFEIITEKLESIKKLREQLDKDYLVEEALIQERLKQAEQRRKSITDLQTKQRSWLETFQTTKTTLETNLSTFKDIDFETEKKQLDNISVLRNSTVVDQTQLESAKKDLQRVKNTISTLETSIRSFEQEIRTYTLDYDLILSLFDQKESLNDQLSKLRLVEQTRKSELSALETHHARLLKDIQAKAEAVESQELDCPTCKQAWPDKDHRQKHIDSIMVEITELDQQINDFIEQIKSKKKEITDIGIVSLTQQLSKIDTSPFKTRDEVINKKNSLSQVKEKLETSKQLLIEEKANLNDIETLVQEIKYKLSKVDSEIKSLQAQCKYESITQLDSTLRRVELLKQELSLHLEKTNPYDEALNELLSQNSEEISYERKDNLAREIAHHKYLEKSLSRKDSDIRRMIVGRWLFRLNEQIDVYVNKLGLPYRVLFRDDLSAAIWNIDEEMAYSDLSSGEEERVILALNLALRDVFETLHFPINVFFVDERLDSGLDGSGRTRAIHCLREAAQIKDRKIFLVTHREEMVDYADRIMLFTKRNNFTEISFD